MRKTTLHFTLCACALLLNLIVTAQTANQVNLAEQEAQDIFTTIMQDVINKTTLNKIEINEFNTYYATQLGVDRVKLFKALLKDKISYKNQNVLITKAETHYIQMVADYRKAKTEFPQSVNEIIHTSHSPMGICSSGCNNMDFGTGTLSGWTTCYANCSAEGTGTPTSFSYTTPTCSTSTDTVSALDASTSSYQVSIIAASSGLDPITGIPKVSPAAGQYSVMVGDGPKVGYGVAELEQTFLITPANNNLTYMYAPVLEYQPGHTKYQVPYISITLFDQNGDTIPNCGNFFAGAYYSTANWLQVNNSGVTYYYLPWQTVSVPLEKYMGTCVTLMVRTSDCGLGGHFGYTYFSSNCSVFGIEVSNGGQLQCNQPISLTAPSGRATYKWSGPCIISSDSLQTITIACAGRYSVISKTAGGGCVDTLDTLISNTSTIATAFNSSTACAGNAIEFTNTTSSTNSYSYNWDFGDIASGTSDTSTETNPSHVYLTAGTYNVTLTVTNGICSGDTIIPITVLPSNGFDLTGNLYICIDTPKNNNSSIQACIYNTRCMPTKGTLKLVLDTEFHITSTVSDSVAHVSGDTLIWSYDSLSDIGKSHCVSLTGTIDSLLVGDSVFVSMFITPTAGDSVPSNNSVTCWVKAFPYNCVGLPFDPNEKSVLPEGNISATQQLSYTIHFQNTGTAVAKNVVVIDTLSPYVDPTTLKVTSASGEVSTSIVSGNIVKFSFNNINLPDTATSKTSSIGVVKYTIYPAASAAPGDVIYNGAGIYFDANPVVKTNTTKSPIVGAPLSVNRISTSLNIACFPNPFTTTTSIVFNTDGTHFLELDDVTGRKIESMVCTGRQYELQRNNLAAGVYFIKAFNAEHIYMAIQKVVVQ
jgi:uncharacterized repeat protein (TIGR01451 family)